MSIDVVTLPLDPVHVPAIDRDALAAVLGSPTRWVILAQLCDGEGYGAGDVAAVAGITASAASKHMALLVRAGICSQGRGRLYKIRREFLAVPGRRVLDFGHCVVRLDLQSA